MTVLDTPNFVEFYPPQNNNAITIRHRKQIVKIDEKIQLTANKDYTPTKQKRVANEHSSQRKIKIANEFSVG